MKRILIVFFTTFLINTFYVSGQVKTLEKIKKGFDLEIEFDEQNKLYVVESKLSNNFSSEEETKDKIVKKYKEKLPRIYINLLELFFNIKFNESNWRSGYGERKDHLKVLNHFPEVSVQNETLNEFLKYENVFFEDLREIKFSILFNEQLSLLDPQEYNELLNIFPDLKYYDKYLEGLEVSHYQNFHSKVLNFSEIYATELERKSQFIDIYNYYSTLKELDIYSKEYLDKVLIKVFEFFVDRLELIPECKTYRRNSYVDGINFQMVSSFLNNLPELEWGENYLFLEERHKNIVIFFLQRLQNLMDYFKDIRQIDNGLKNEITEWYDVFQSSNYIDCFVVKETLGFINSDFSEKQIESVLDFIENNPCSWINESCEIDFSEYKNRYQKRLNNLSVNKKGSCTREKHEERIEKEYYPDNGLKITRGITRIILTESGNCKYSWEVYDTTLRGKTRISYFITRSDNPEDSTISIELIGTDEF